LIPKHLPFSGANNAVVNFRHALALDERRVKFMPFFCTTPGKVKDGLETLDSTISNQTEDLRQRKTTTGRGRSESSLDFETGVNALTGPDTDVEEVFFAGAHCGKHCPFHSQKTIVFTSPTFKMSEVVPWATTYTTVSLAFPFDG
jgi:hypothetical protein